MKTPIQYSSRSDRVIDRLAANRPNCFIFVVLGVVLATTSSFAQKLSPEDRNDDAAAAELRQHFGEQQFLPQGGFILTQGKPLPELVWENPQRVATVVENPAIPTRWFNTQLEEVQTADQPGRYYAYGEAPVPAGPPLRRAMTCYCVGKELDLSKLTEQHVATTDSNQPRADVAALLKSWRTTEVGAVELAALLEQDQSTTPARPGQWQMENATQHVRLKRKLMGLEEQPIVKAMPRKLTGDPAPILHRAPLAETGMTQSQVDQIKAKLDEWYADSSEPMAVVILHKGAIVLAESYGTVDDKEVTIHTPMKLDSAMKPLIGLQLATYFDRGLIDLDEPIGNFLPEFKTPKDQNLTFRAGHVHATGILFPWELAFRRLFYFHTWHESLIAHCPREWNPGTRHRYGVVGVILSVRALELLRGRNYWDAMERDLFAPLGIRDMLPGGTGFSAENMARIGLVMDNRGKYGPWEVISEETHAAILPTSLKPNLPELNMKYGIGFQDHSRLLGPGSYGHGGGCGTQLTIDPEQHLVFAMVRNAPGKEYQKHRTELMALLRATRNR